MFIGYIYKITGACGKVYIGSTVNLYQRIYGHNGSDNQCQSKFLENPLVFEIIRKDEYKLNKTMRLVEQFYIDNIDCINKNRAFMKIKERAPIRASLKEECKYCKKLINKFIMERHHQSKDCLWARKNPEMIKWYYDKYFEF
jgi:predicted GIY-YIG superfamily endonuclease